ncbi:hypothetical protein Pelo_2555 [Pelomyxa schiedti]|nr:hypothetical protein Pelo_2555 [Pelomyxa schiedti]
MQNLYPSTQAQARLDLDKMQSAAVHAMSDTIGAGNPLKAKLEEWVRDCKEKRCCAIGMNNYLREKTLSEPDYYIHSGKVIEEPPGECHSEMGAPMLFCKRHLAMKGTAGVMSYNIMGHDARKLTVYCMWSVPEVIGQNCFNVMISEPMEEELSMDTWRKLYHEAKHAKDGEITVQFDQYRCTCSMTPDSMATLICNLWEQS